MSLMLGRLEKVELRHIWESEATHFTPWLAREDNLALLSEIIGLDLELEAQEKSVGPFRADILCKDTTSDNWVLIENQLERTDHTHLGQLLTYAAGLKAATIVWVAQRFTEEHRSALDWLNDITDDRFNFFGLEIELWRIGDSPVAPKFNVISKPNEWTKNVAQGAKQIELEELSETRRIQYQFWFELAEYLIQHKAQFNIGKPKARQWANVALGKTGFTLHPIFNTKPSEIRVDLYIKHSQAKAYFQALYQEKDNIESELGNSLTWLLLPEGKFSKIVLSESAFDPLDVAQWPAMREWFLENISNMQRVFAPKIKLIEPENWNNSFEPNDILNN